MAGSRRRRGERVAVRIEEVQVFRRNLQAEPIAGATGPSASSFDEGAQSTVLVTLHLKA